MNFARPRSEFCAAHKGESVSAAGGQSVIPDGVESFAERAAREDREQRQAAAAEFRRRLEEGDYKGLFGGRLGTLMVQAAAEDGLDDVVGILRIVMARLMVEEHDPVIQAKSLARVAGVLIQAARAKRAINGQLAEGLTDAITSILAELDGSTG
jgi:hypothetical protein